MCGPILSWHQHMPDSGATPCSLFHRMNLLSPHCLMGVAMPDDDRLDRIERKLDTMAEAIITLARMEERMVTLFRRMDSYD